MNNCKKCGNPNIMYWCSDCDSSEEYITCSICEKDTEVDENYHDNCNE